MKRCSTSLIIRKNANQNYNELLPYTSQNGHKQSLQAINAGEGIQKKEPSYTAGRKINWCSHMENSMEVLDKKINKNRFAI